MPHHAVPGRRRRPVTTALLALVAAVFAITLGMLTTGTADATSPGSGGTVGTTQGWYDGKTVTLQYEKNYYCDRSVSSAASSGCEVGADLSVPPRSGPIPVLYVAVPLFDPTENLNLQCPVAGSCVDHPSTIDLSRLFGDGTKNALLPAHSHVVGERAGGWWDVEVVGITSQSAWDTLAAGKSLDTLHQLQAAGTATGDIPTNLDLFFNVR
jgi:hypothetical protein